MLPLQPRASEVQPLLMLFLTNPSPLTASRWAGNPGEGRRALLWNVLKVGTVFLHRCQLNPPPTSRASCWVQMWRIMVYPSPHPTPTSQAQEV